MWLIVLLLPVFIILFTALLFFTHDINKFKVR